jgi:regulator of PEP synthase PpsR (kinase-PPPase family)
MMNTTQFQPPIYVVSGGKGVAGHAMVHSLLIQYPNNKVSVEVFPDIQSHEKIENVVMLAKKNQAVIAHTMVNAGLRSYIRSFCMLNGVEQFDFMSDLASYLENKLGLISESVPGLYRRSDPLYFDRIDAIEFTLAQDDGVNPERLRNAEIVLLGLSRSGKTPLSIYMSMFGWRVANVPLVKGIQPPEELFDIDPGRVFGLSINLPSLLGMRNKRMDQLGDVGMINYNDTNYIREEIQYANFIYERGGFTRINVTNKPIETTANEIIQLISERFGNSHSAARDELR